MDHQIVVSLGAVAEAALTRYVQENARAGETVDQYLTRMCQKFVLGMLTRAAEDIKADERQSLVAAFESANDSTKASIRTALGITKQ